MALQSQIPRQADKLHHLFTATGVHVAHYPNRRRTHTHNGPSSASIAHHSRAHASFVHSTQAAAAPLAPPTTSSLVSTAARVSTRTDPWSSHLSQPSTTSATATSPPSSTAASLSLFEKRNRQFYHSSLTHLSAKEIDSCLHKLFLYGFITSHDIAKMQPWQLRVLKKESQEMSIVDQIYLTAFQMYGQMDMYDESLNKSIYQWLDPGIWLEYNEMALIDKCFDRNEWTYRCWVCGNDSLSELDGLRWHVWIYHRQGDDFKRLVSESKIRMERKTSLKSKKKKTSMNREIIELIDSEDEEKDRRSKKQGRVFGAIHDPSSYYRDDRHSHSHSHGMAPHDARSFDASSSSMSLDRPMPASDEMIHQSIQNDPSGMMGMDLFDDVSMNGFNAMNGMGMGMDIDGMGGASADSTFSMGMATPQGTPSFGNAFM